MRKLIYSANVSLDGFIETPDRGLDWVQIDEELHQHFNDQARGIDAWLYGRRMYELMARDWPYADRDPSAPDYIVEFAEIWRQMPKVVFSKTLKQVDWNARLVSGDAGQEVARLKAQPGKDLSVSGAELSGSLMRLGLVDEYQIYIQPVVLGAGTRMFPALSERIDLQLVESRTFTLGVVRLVYGRRQ
jgi:dihydrofolate reductase